jgi:pimeloyl-ACP methyl ester carboxylesterase
MNHLTTSHIIVLCLLASLHAQLYPYPGSAEMENAKAGDLVLKPGQLKEYAADFGTLVVPESRGKKDSRLIRLPVLRMRSRREHPLEPVFTLEGGPGGTNIKPDYIRDWLLENHDVVMVGYRGVDGSVSLNCPEVSAALKTMADPLSQAGLKELGAVMTRAAQRLQDEGIDLPEYDIINVVDDLEAARKALGYSRINLSGASYGGAVAYTYCIRYPQSLHRNLMGEPAFPWDIGVTEPKDIDKNLARLNTLWKQNPDCLKRSKDIVQTIRSVLKALPQSWQQIRIDPGRVKLWMRLWPPKTATTAAWRLWPSTGGRLWTGSTGATWWPRHTVPRRSGRAITRPRWTHPAVSSARRSRNWVGAPSSIAIGRANRCPWPTGHRRRPT